MTLKNPHHPSALLPTIPNLYPNQPAIFGITQKFLDTDVEETAGQYKHRTLTEVEDLQ